MSSEVPMASVVVEAETVKGTTPVPMASVVAPEIEKEEEGTITLNIDAKDASEEGWCATVTNAADRADRFCIGSAQEHFVMMTDLIRFIAVKSHKRWPTATKFIVGKVKVDFEDDAGCMKGMLQDCFNRLK
jgi:hypothetical protein